MFENVDILITTSIIKNNLLKNFNNQFLKYKIYSISEFNKLFYFDYDEQTIYYVMKNYHVRYEIAKIYLDNLYYIEDKKYLSNKLIFLSSLKKELLDNNLLIIKKLFQSTLKNKTICLYNLPSSKEINLLVDKLKLNNNVITKNDEIKTYNHTIKEFKTIEDEVEYVINSICRLIKQGIDISHIFITNLDNEYRKLFKRLLPMFNIPYTLNDTSSIYSTYICTKFLELYSDNLEETVTNLKEYVTDEESEKIYNKIINIINKYVLIDDQNIVKEMIIYDLKKTNISKQDIIASLHEVNLKNTLFKDEDYIFILSFNQGIIPSIYKDESYLTDKDKEELNISLTIDKNNSERELIINKLQSLKNLTITYKLNAFGEVYYPSSINETLKYDVEIIEDTDLSNSNLYNKIKLTSLLDEYNKYGTKSDLLYTLNNTYQDLPYNIYNNKFKGLNNALFLDFINHKLTLSYTTLDRYFSCPFSYYIGNILKLNIFETTFDQVVGSLFHAILEKFNTSKLSYDELWQQELSSLTYEFNLKEKFFLTKLKKELLFIIETIKEQDNYINLKNELHEERIITNIEGNIKITFTGVIDKLKYKEVNGETIVAIIDYKTGSPNLSLDTIPYGIGMQLPIYLYLAKNTSKLKNVKIAGFYLQKILNNEVTVDKSKTYEQLKKENLLLQGYSNSDHAILSEFDTTFADSMLIRGMRLKENNDFYFSAKNLSSKDMDELVTMTEDKIKEGAKQIEEGNFAIAPKKIGKENYGCRFCKFKDICFHTAKDIEELEPLDIKEVLGKGGENNELD